MIADLSNLYGYFEDYIRVENVLYQRKTCTKMCACDPKPQIVMLCCFCVSKVPSPSYGDCLVIFTGSWSDTVRFLLWDMGVSHPQTEMLSTNKRSLPFVSATCFSLCEYSRSPQRLLRYCACQLAHKLYLFKL